MIHNKIDSCEGVAELPRRQYVVNVLKGTLQISKMAAAQRQLDAAIRMFFDREDELAIHTVAAAAFQVLRDLTKKRGVGFTTEVFREGIVSIAKQYADGTLPPDELAMIEGSALKTMIEPLIVDIRDRGDKFDKSKLRVKVSKQQEHKLWLSETTVYHKHADRDHNNFLAADDLDNEKILMATCAAYLKLMNRPTPEITAYFAFWAAKNHEVDGLAEELQKFARKLERANEGRRYKLCVRYLRENKRAATRGARD